MSLTSFYSPPKCSSSSSSSTPTPESSSSHHRPPPTFIYPISNQIKCIQQLQSFSTKRHSLKPAHCSPPQQIQQEEEDVGTMCDCEPCSGTGWLLCSFCNGQKTNVKSENNRIYRRCPTCRAIGYVLCSNCKVFKCVTFPDYSDVEQ